MARNPRKRKRRNDDDDFACRFEQTPAEQWRQRAPYSKRETNAQQPHWNLAPPERQFVERPRKRPCHVPVNYTTTGHVVDVWDGFSRPSSSGGSKTTHHYQKPPYHPPREPVTIVNTLPHPAEGVEVVYTKDPHAANFWIQQNVLPSTSAIGLDIEWRPQFVPKRLGGKENKTATLQLAVDHSCLVLHIFHMSLASLPHSLCRVLANQDILKVGSGIKGDAVKLALDTGLLFDGRVDTQACAKAVRTQSGKLGLKSLAAKFLGIKMDKPRLISMSNWEFFPLNKDQISYAAFDAWISLKLFQKLKEVNGNRTTSQVKLEELVEIGVPVTKAQPALFCQSCGKKCKGKEALEKHIDEKHTEIGNQMTFGEDNSVRESQVITDREIIVIEDSEPEEQGFSESVLMCPVCQADFINEKQLQEHLETFMHTSCPKCGKQFLHKISKNHKKKCKG